MIIFKSILSNKEKKHISSLLYEMSDVYGDFYITRNNLRLFIKENQNVLFDCLKRGDKIAFNNAGIGVICGFSDKAERKYLKVLTNDPKFIENVLKIISWNFDCDLYIKIKKNNPQRGVLEKNYFRFAGDRGREVLLVRRAKKHVERTQNQNPGLN